MQLIPASSSISSAGVQCQTRNITARGPMARLARLLGLALNSH